MHQVRVRHASRPRNLNAIISFETMVTEILTRMRDDVCTGFLLEIGYELAIKTARVC